MLKVLLVHPDEGLSREIQHEIARDGLQVATLSHVDLALKSFQETFFHLLIISDRFSYEKVRLLINQALMVREDFPIFVLACKKGRTALLAPKETPHIVTFSEPLDVPLLARFCRQKTEELKLKRRVAYLCHRQNYIYNFDQIIGHESGLKDVVESITKVSPSTCSILITGETGTGKELIAAAIHYNSLRRDENFVAVNCAALHENLLESELFGHEKGAFTGADKRRVGRFEQAHGGTLFLDEIGEMSLSTQVKVLRILQNQQFERLGSSQTMCVDVRIIAATNRNLKLAIQKGAFRDDLFYRLNVFPIRIPPLRERRQDIPALSRFFLKKCRAEYNKEMEGFHPQAIKKLMDYEWPGNVRELQNAIERAILLAETPVILPQDLELEPNHSQMAGASCYPLNGAPFLPLEQMEKEYIQHGLHMSGGVQKEAAALLGITPRALHYKIKKHGIKVSNFK
jgi:DNA-binding NtrC family response regulator